MPGTKIMENEGLLDQERRCYKLLTTQNGHLWFSKTNKKPPQPPLYPQNRKQISMEFIRNGAKFIPQVNEIILQYVKNSNLIYLCYKGVSQISLFYYACIELSQNEKKSRLLQTS